MEIKKKFDFLRKNKTNILYKFLQLISLFVVMWALNNVTILDIHQPFGIAMLFALIWCGYSPFWLGGVYAITYYLTDFSMSSAKLAIAIFIICLVLFFVKKIKKFSYPKYIIFVLCLAAYIPYIWLFSGDLKSNLTLVIAVVFAMFFLYVSIYFLQGTIKRGFSLRLNSDEKICGGIVLALIAFGLASSSLPFDIATMISVVVTLLAAYTFGMLESIAIAFVFGLGVSLYYFNPIFISFYLSFAFFASAFKTKTKIFSAIAVIIVYLFFTLYFVDFLVFKVVDLVILAAVSLIFCLFPAKVLNFLKDVFAGSKNKIAVRNVVKSSKDKVAKKLTDIARVFKEMEYSFKRTLQRVLPITEKKDMMKQDIVDMVCRDCPSKNKCLRINGEYTTQVFDSIIEAGVNKGRVTDVDVNKYLLTRCSKVPYLVSSANEVIRAYREYVVLSNNMDCSKILVAEQFNGVSNVMQGMAKEISEDISFDTELEKRIMEDLLYKNIFCEEVVVYEKNISEKTIVLLVRNDKMDAKAIEKIVSKVIRTAVNIISIEPSEVPNISVVTIATRANFDIVFGSATCNKAGVIVSGDTHSFVKIDNGKYMLALSDGMGSGTIARETSDLAIGLIENYYRAGFDNELILSSVNKLLSLNNEESFSAIDLCILDFFNNTMDFVKLGTPHSYIKTKSGVEVIQSSGLPIGILEEIRPHVTKKYINNFDIIILVSDGVNDVFGEKELRQYINSLNMINPKEISDAILTKAKTLSHGVCADDMTVVAARIFATK